MTRTVHLLMVHGVGRHDKLSSLFKTYQSFRANTRSSEAPINFEDLILDWTLEEVDENASPPYMKLVPRFPEAMRDVAAMYLYEVNYSTIAGVVRQNHPLDLTQLFVGFDLAVCVTRRALNPHARTTLCEGRPAELARSLQRVAGVLIAATVPLLGAPSMLLRDYTETMVATFTRFFEDVATFALDKNGEKVISAHLDKTIDNIVTSGRFTGVGTPHPSELVIAAHSLGSVVAHHHLVRHWSTRTECVPRLLVTFGSPVGLITWLWLFLDFPNFAVTANDEFGLNFFCWGPQDNSGQKVQPLRWLNIVNRLDPIATAFNAQAADLSRTAEDIRAGLSDGDILHRYYGDSRLWSTGAAHANYLYDRREFIRMLLGACSLRNQDPAEITGTPADLHWLETARVLGRVRIIVWLAAMTCAAGYLGLVAWKFSDWRVFALLPLFAWPPVTIGGVAFFQRLLFGGATKRIWPGRIQTLSWQNLPSIAYRIRLLWSRHDVDPDAHANTTSLRVKKLVSFLPTLVAMSVPIGFGAILTGTWPDPRIGVVWSVTGLLAFTGYLVMCAAFELIAAWRAVLRELELVPGWSRRE